MRQIWSAGQTEPCALGPGTVLLPYNWIELCAALCTRSSLIYHTGLSMYLMESPTDWVIQRWGLDLVHRPRVEHPYIRQLALSHYRPGLSSNDDSKEKRLLYSLKNLWHWVIQCLSNTYFCCQSNSQHGAGQKVIFPLPDLFAEEMKPPKLCELKPGKENICIYF